MSAAAAERARKCFALAKSTEHAGERDAAVNRGLRILERAGLDPDRFDIPGRERGQAKVAGCPHGLGINIAYCPVCKRGVATGPYAPFHEYGTTRTAYTRPFFSHVQPGFDNVRAASVDGMESFVKFAEILRTGIVDGDAMADILRGLKRDTDDPDMD